MVHIFKVDGQETKVGDKKTLKVRNVCNAGKMIELQIGESGEKVEVHHADLEKAISNAINNERY